MSERTASNFRRSTATLAEQRMMVLLSAAKIPYVWQSPFERLDDLDRFGMPKRYWVDFRIPNFDIVIEVDGDAHNGEEEYDLKRDKYLESRGYKVIWFTNRAVLHDGAKVIEAILKEMGVE